MRHGRARLRGKSPVFGLHWSAWREDECTQALAFCPSAVSLTDGKMEGEVLFRLLDMPVRTSPM